MFSGAPKTNLGGPGGLSSSEKRLRCLGTMPVHQDTVVVRGRGGPLRSRLPSQHTTGPVTPATKCEKSGGKNRRKTQCPGAEGAAWKWEGHYTWVPPGTQRPVRGHSTQRIPAGSARPGMGGTGTAVVGTWL